MAEGGDEHRKIGELTITKVRYKNEDSNGSDAIELGHKELDPDESDDKLLGHKELDPNESDAKLLGHKELDPDESDAKLLGHKELDPNESDAKLLGHKELEPNESDAKLLGYKEGYSSESDDKLRSPKDGVYKESYAKLLSHKGWNPNENDVKLLSYKEWDSYESDDKDLSLEEDDSNESNVPPESHEEGEPYASYLNDDGLTDHIGQLELNPVNRTPAVVVVVTCDGKEFRLTHNVTSKSNVLVNMISDTVAEHDDSTIELLLITAPTMEKIIEFGEHDADLHSVENECPCKLSDWHNNTFFWVNQDTLFKMIKAADFLDIPCLFKLASYTIARLIEGKSVEEIRKIFGIKNDFTPYQYRMAEAEANNILQRHYRKP